MDLSEKIKTGRYDPKAIYPLKPIRPPVLRKPAGDLTAAELESIAAIKAEADRVDDVYKLGVKAFNSEQAECQGRFTADLVAECGVTDPMFASAMYAIACDRAYGYEYSGIIDAFNDLMPLWELYDAKHNK